MHGWKGYTEKKMEGKERGRKKEEEVELQSEDNKMRYHNWGKCVPRYLLSACIWCVCPIKRSTHTSQRILFQGALLVAAFLKIINFFECLCCCCLPFIFNFSMVSFETVMGLVPIWNAFYMTYFHTGANLSREGYPLRLASLPLPFPSTCTDGRTCVGPPLDNCHRLANVDRAG